MKNELLWTISLNMKKQRFVNQYKDQHNKLNKNKNTNDYMSKWVKNMISSLKNIANCNNIIVI